MEHDMLSMEHIYTLSIFCLVTLLGGSEGTDAWKPLGPADRQVQ